MESHKSKSFSEGGSYILPFIGTESTGKTICLKNILTYLETLGYRVFYLDEGARIADMLGKAINIGTSIATQQWILDDLELQLQAAIHRGYDIILTDRTFLDNTFGYWARIAESQSMPKDEIEEHLQVWGIDKTLEYADALFYYHSFPINSQFMTKLITDNQKSRDAEFRRDCGIRIDKGVVRLEQEHPEIIVAHNYPTFQSEINSVAEWQSRLRMAIHSTYETIDSVVLSQIEYKLEERHNS